MKKIFAQVLISLFKNRIYSLTINNLKKNTNEINTFLKELDKELREEIDKYPSFLNSGYLHIDRAIELVQYLKLPQNNIIIDIGAANGITPAYFSNAFPLSPIYAFEPTPNSFELLKQSTEFNKNIYPINKALGNEKKSININITSRITSSSLLNINEGLSNDFWKENLSAEGKAEIIMTRLDDEIPKRDINICKLDVQGYEMEVLKGATDTLKRIAIIIVEMQNHNLYINSAQYHDIDKFLRLHEFELYNIIPSIRQNKKLYEWDSIYVNKRIIK